MKYRTTEILDATDVGPSGTKSIDINIKDIISRITIGWKTTKSKYGMDAFPYEDITKIELVDGSEVLHSLDGGPNQALCIFDRKVPTMNHGQHVNAASEYANFGIDFGRFLFDTMLALDPKRFNNLQLKITYDEDVADTGVTANELEIWAHCFDEKIVTPLGFLMAKEIYKYTAGAENSYEYVDLPVDLAIRRLILQGFYDGAEPWAQIKEARLSEDNDKHVPFDWELEKYYRTHKGVWQEIIEQFYGYADTSSTYVYYITPTDYFAGVFGHILGGTVQGAPTGVTPGGQVTLNAGTAGNFHGLARGYLPNHCFDFPMGDPQDIEDWLDKAGEGSLRLRLKAGSSGSSSINKVVLQQLRKY